MGPYSRSCSYSNGLRTMIIMVSTDMLFAVILELIYLRYYIIFDEKVSATRRREPAVVRAIIATLSEYLI